MLLHKKNLNLVDFKMQDFTLLSASPTNPTPRIFFVGKVTTRKSGFKISMIFFTYLGDMQEPLSVFVPKEGKSHIQSPTSHAHMPFCSIKIEVVSSAQSMNWCENISLCMKKKKKRDSFRRFSTRVYISERRLRSWRNKHATWLFHIFSTLREFNWLRKSQRQYPP